MEQIWIPKIGPPEVLEVREAPDPEPGPGELRIRVEAAGVNFADLMARMGLYPDAPKLPAVVGYEVAGTVDAVGQGVDTTRIGQRVMAMTRFGGYSSAVTVAEIQAAIIPDGLESTVAAAIPVTGLTAWMMLEVMGRVREGDRVLVHSGGGGVGLMALDLIRWRGAEAVGVASPAKHEKLKQLGYSEVVDSRNPEALDVFRNSPGFDLILDPVGGPSWSRSFSLLRPGGRLICYGFSSNAQGRTRRVWTAVRNLSQVPWLAFNPIRLMNQNLGVLGVNMGRLWNQGERARTWLDGLQQLWQQGGLRPLVHAAVPFSEAAEAHRILHDRENLGKVVLVPDSAG
ncbi:MAG: alcohol dehydrogenase [Planctomycetota bacterium]|nr:MAG: alcohol dehydrogenase [Planctomycetota bacterium]